jgi:hypothetical protein
MSSDDKIRDPPRLNMTCNEGKNSKAKMPVNIGKGMLAAWLAH